MLKNKLQELLQLADSNKNQSSVNSAKRFFSHSEQARSALLEYKSKILDIDVWNKISVLTSYRIFDEIGQETENQLIAVNAFLRLSLKGSGKYDWVKVYEIHETENELIITVKPIFDPTDKTSQKAETSHFFASESCNNFCLLQDQNSVSFYVVGLDEKQNTEEAKNPLEIIRNVATANIGSYLGIQKNEWKTFCKNFLDYYTPDSI